MSDTYFKQRLSRRNITPITDEVIKRLAKTRLFESDNILNTKLYELHQTLLTYAKNKNNSCEAGILWAFKGNEYVIIKGAENGIDLYGNERAKVLLNTSNDYSLVFMHNHPKNSNFSYKDLHSFCNNYPILAMTAVCNDGRIHLLRKEGGFQPTIVKMAYNDAFDSGKNGIREVLNHAAQLKLMYRCSIPRKEI